MHFSRGPMIDRRHFLRTSAVALAAVAGGRTVWADDKDEFGGFTLGTQTYTYRKFTLEQALKKTKELGLHYVELTQVHVPLDSKPEQLASVLKLCKEYDITPVAYGVQHFSKSGDENRKAFELGKALGLKSLSADPDPDSFDALDKLCDEYKIAIAIHPHGPIGKDKLHRWYSAEIILDAVKDHNPLIGTCIDTGHMIRSAKLGKNLDSADQIRKMGARNFGIHLKDNDNEKDTNVVFGKGALDVPGVLKALREVKFKGAISIEYEAKPEDPSEDMKGCVAVFKESVKKLA
jgi:inosose dehydratase